MTLENKTYLVSFFKGFLHETELEKYYLPKIGATVQYRGMPIDLLFLEGITVRELAEKIIAGANLNGIRTIGDPDTIVHRVAIQLFQCTVLDLLTRRQFRFLIVQMLTV